VKSGHEGSGNLSTPAFPQPPEGSSLNRLSREVVVSPSLEVFKKLVDMALQDMV